MTDRITQAQDLLIEQYKDSTNLIAVIDAHSTENQAIDDEINNLLDKRGLDTAEGLNLDLIGRIVVLDRPFTDPDPTKQFAHAGGDDIGLGFGDIAEPTTGGVWFDLDIGENDEYSDDLYRLILKAKIIYNTTDGTLEDMHKYVQFVFGVEAVIMEKVGSVDLHIARPYGTIEREILNQTFPLPAGIRLDTLSFSYEEGSFGFTGKDSNGGFGDLDDAEIGGGFSSLVID